MSSNPSGKGYAYASGATASSANPPSASQPVKRGSSQRFSCVAQAEPAGPHVDRNQATPTRSPCSNRGRARAGTDDLAHDLVPGNDPWTLGGQLAVAEVEVGPAHAAGPDGQQHLPGARHGSRLLDQAEPALGLAGPSGRSTTQARITRPASSRRSWSQGQTRDRAPGHPARRPRRGAAGRGRDVAGPDRRRSDRGLRRRLDGPLPGPGVGGGPAGDDRGGRGRGAGLRAGRRHHRPPRGQHGPGRWRGPSPR